MSACQEKSKTGTCIQKRINGKALWQRSTMRVCVGNMKHQHEDRWRNQQGNVAVPESHGCVSETQNKLCENYICYISLTSLIGHCECGSSMFFFHEMSVPKWEPGNMNWYSLHITGHIKHKPQALNFTCIQIFTLSNFIKSGMT